MFRGLATSADRLTGAGVSGRRKVAVSPERNLRNEANSPRVFAKCVTVKCQNGFQAEAMQTRRVRLVLPALDGLVDCKIALRRHVMRSQSSASDLTGRLVATRLDPQTIPLVHFRGGYLGPAEV
jgi:hypothetical protein